MDLTEEFQDNRESSSGSLPEGVRFITARAIVEEMSVELSEDPDIQVAIQTAAHMPMVTNGEPTKLLVSSWMLHEGKNNNNLVFRAEDLEDSAAKITTPNLLPLDWNHSAVVPKEGVPKAIGVWYTAEAKWDPDAYEGRGANGIFAKGVVWAWAFPEYAQEMLKIQKERGYIEFSMACIPTSTESGRDQNGPYEVAIKPVLFTLSALNMPPGDPDAKGIIENAEDVQAESYKDWWDEVEQVASSDSDLERAAVLEVSGAKKDSTNFPRSGENKEVSLRNSQWKLFPLKEATDLKENWPEIWSRGGNVRGNDQFRRLTPVARRGGKVTTSTEEYAVRLREAWVARHYEDFQLAGVVAQIKWLAVGSRGLGHMRSVINEAKERVKARRAEARTEEASMEQHNDLPQAALEAALEANAVLKAEVEGATATNEQLTSRIAELEQSVAEALQRAEEAELKGDALQTELATAAEQLSAAAAELETAHAQLAEIAAEREQREVEQRWAARFAELPEAYRAAFARRTEEEQDRFKVRWAGVTDEAWSEFKNDVFVGFADTKISYLKLSEKEGALPAGGVSDLSAVVSALIK